MSTLHRRQGSAEETSPAQRSSTAQSSLEQEERQEPPHSARRGSSNASDVETWAQTFHVILIRYFYSELIRSFSSAGPHREADPIAIFRLFLGHVKQISAEMERHLDAGPSPLDGLTWLPLAEAGEGLDKRLAADHLPLTPAQVKVMRLLNDGLPPERIAEQLHVQVATVYTHIGNVTAELRAHGHQVRGTLQALGVMRRLSLLGDDLPG